MTGVQPAAAPVGVNAFLIAISTLAVSLRLVSRKLSDANFWWDDWLAFAAWPLSASWSATMIAAASHGFGRHDGDPRFILHAVYALELLYTTEIALTKLSVLALYHRIFSSTRRMRIAILVLGAIVIIWWVCFALVGLLQCFPIHAYWDWDVKHRCIDKWAVQIAQAVPNIILDFALLLLPVVPLWKLHMKRSQKVALVVLFMLGYLNPVISILRIVAFLRKGRVHDDISHGMLVPALWTGSEMSVAVVSCSIPSLTYLFRRMVSPSTIQKRIRKRSTSISTKRINGIQPVGSDDRDFWRLQNEPGYDAKPKGPNPRTSTAEVLDHETTEDPPSYVLNEIVVTRLSDVM